MRSIESKPSCWKDNQNIFRNLGIVTLFSRQELAESVYSYGVSNPSTISKEYIFIPYDVLTQTKLTPLSSSYVW